MKNKARIRRNIKRLQRIKTWQLAIIFLIMAVVSASFLRLNNIGMVERRAAVILADNQLDSKATKDRLLELQRYVSSHMNTSMGKGLYLEASYKRDLQAAYSAAVTDNNPNGNIYKKAQEVCMPQFSYWSYAYVQCTANELAKYPAGKDLIDSVKEPSPNSYLHVFASPVWSPDLAGWSVLICVVILIMIIVRLISVGILKIFLHYRYKSI